MHIGRVVGNVISTKKIESLTGERFLVIELVEQKGKDIKESGKQIVAVDSVGAGRGEYVLVTFGSAARQLQHHLSVPIDAAIIGIIDSFLD